MGMCRPGHTDPSKSAAVKYMISPITGQQVPVEQASARSCLRAGALFSDVVVQIESVYVM